MTGEVWLSLDYGNFEITRMTRDSVSGQYVGTISVGGSPASTERNVVGFEGCIKV